MFLFVFSSKYLYSKKQISSLPILGVKFGEQFLNFELLLISKYLYRKTNLENKYFHKNLKVVSR